MDLASHQRMLLGLVRGTHVVLPHDDPYYHRVATSTDLEVARTNIALWRLFVLERTCVLTVALLRRRQSLMATLDAFVRSSNISPFREFQALAFLEFLHDHPDALLASVSQFELALTKVRDGDPGPYHVHWSREPTAVLMALAQNDPLEEAKLDGSYMTRISGELPFLFEASAAPAI
jgi:hypothetical protein